MLLTKHVVIVGGGFAGLEAAKALADSPVRVTVVDKSNHHLFQPLLYQVAMAGLSPAEIASPIRHILGAQENARVLLDEVVDIDRGRKRITMRHGAKLDYDFLILATGAQTNYFGHDEWAEFAPGLKDLDDAVEIRRRVLLAFEAAERDADDVRRRQLLTFVIIGGGPTGVELAGAIAELAGTVLAQDFRVIHPEGARVVLLEGGPRILPSFDEQLAQKAAQQLRELGVEIHTRAMVTDINERGVEFGLETVECDTVLWAAGVRSPLGAMLGVARDRQGRVLVASDCSVEGHSEVFVVGDAACFTPTGDERPLPGVSPVAMQQGRFVAEQIARTIAGQPRQAFTYVSRGEMATIGRSRAVAQVGKLQLSGFVAWLSWLFVHLWFLVEFRNRVLVFFAWAWSYATYQRGSRLITGRRLHAGAPSAMDFAYGREAIATAPASASANGVDGSDSYEHATSDVLTTVELPETEPALQAG